MDKESRIGFGKSPHALLSGFESRETCLGANTFESEPRSEKAANLLQVLVRLGNSNRMAG